MSDEPMLTTADMLEIAASGGNGAEYVDVSALMGRAARDLRMAEARIVGMRAQIKTVLDREAATAARHDAKIAAAEARARALEKERDALRRHIAHIHNKVRHDLSAEIEAAMDKAFGAMSGTEALRTGGGDE